MLYMCVHSTWVSGEDDGRGGEKKGKLPFLPSKCRPLHKYYYSHVP